MFVLLYSSLSSYLTSPLTQSYQSYENGDTRQVTYASIHLLSSSSFTRISTISDSTILWWCELCSARKPEG